MQLPSRRARVAVLTGVGALAVAAPASAAPTSAFDAASGKLTLAYPAGEDLAVAAAAGKVTLNGGATTVDAGAVKSIEIAETGTDVNSADTVDLRGVAPAAYTQLAGTFVKAGAGADTIFGSFADDRLEANTQADTVLGLDGDDTLVWRNGDNSDVLRGGDGVDTIESNGADAGPSVNEVYTVRAEGKGFVFTRSSAVQFSLTVDGAERYVNNMLGGDDRFSMEDPTKPVAGIAITINAGAGNDTVSGTNGADALNGDDGADTLVGFRGNDAMAGGAGDDLMVWNAGDNSDTMDGGAGTDVAQLNGAAAGEHFVVTAQGQRVTATRDNVTPPFLLDIGTAETFDLNGNAGDDSVDVNSGLAALLKVDADLGDGNDTITARNDSAEKIDGGAGTDSAVVDASDAVANVERARGAAGPKVAILSKRLAVDGGRAAVRVRCPAGVTSCEGRIKIKRGGKVAGSLATKLTGGQARTFAVPLNRATRIALAKAPGKRLTVKLVVTAKDAAGNGAKVARTIALKG